MKKIFVLFLVLFTVTLSLSAQVSVDLSFLKGQKAVSYVLDKSELTIQGMTIADWLQYRQQEQPQYNAKEELETELYPQLLGIFVFANDKLDDRFQLTTRHDCTYTLYAYPQNFTTKGGNTIKYVILETATGRKVTEFFVTSRGGVFGTMSNLWGDGVKNAGQQLAKMLKKAVY